MKNIIKIIIALVATLLLPLHALAATYTVPWTATTTTGGLIYPFWNGAYQPIIVPTITASSSSGTSRFLGNVDVSGTLHVVSALNLDGFATVGSSLTVTGDISGADLNVSGAVNGDSLSFNTGSIASLATNGISLNGVVNDSLASPGTNGYVLTSTGSATQWLPASGGVGTSTNPFIATYFVATSTTVASRFPYASTTALSSTGSAYFATSGGNVSIGTASDLGSNLGVQGTGYFSGKVGIGTTSPLSKLDVSASDSGTTVSSASASMMNLTNTNTTAGNFSDYAFATVNSGLSTLVTGKIAGVYTSHTAAAESMEMQLWTMNAGTFAQRATLSASGNFGIGTTSPVSTLSVGGNLYVDNNGPLSYSVIGQPLVLTTFNGTNGTDTFIVGTSTTGTNSQRVMSVSGMYNGGTPTATVQAINAFATLGSSATTDLTSTGSGGGLRNRYVVTNNSLGHNVNTMSAISVQVNTGGSLASTTNAVGLNVEGIGTSAGALTTNAYGVRVQGNSPNGTITNRYGVYIEDLLTGTNRYGFYQAGASDNNFFKGNVGIGTTSPNWPLSVVGDGYFTGFNGVTARAFYATSTAVSINTTTINNTAASTTVFGLETWKSRTWSANTLKAASQVCFDMKGTYSTTGITPSAIVRILVGDGSATTTLAQKTTTAIGAGVSGLAFDGDGCITIRTIGASASLQADGKLIYESAAGTSKIDPVRGTATAVDITSSKTFDVTVQFDTASALEGAVINQASLWIK